MLTQTVAIGIQDFEKIRERNVFYIDKTAFIREWWERKDDVTLITRPRRFGKTLSLSMLECFFSNKYAGRGDLFEGLAIWDAAGYRKLQGTYPVIFISFAGVKQNTFEGARAVINQKIADVYNAFAWITGETWFTDADRSYYSQVNMNMNEATASVSINKLCIWLARHYGKKCIVLLDEYDTPLQEAYVYGFWDEIVSYIRALFNNTFKTNPALERALMTGITRTT